MLYQKSQLSAEAFTEKFPVVINPSARAFKNRYSVASGGNIS
jgi:hypothetical protein